MDEEQQEVRCDMEVEEEVQVEEEEEEEEEEEVYQGRFVCDPCSRSFGCPGGTHNCLVWRGDSCCHGGRLPNVCWSDHHLIHEGIHHLVDLVLIVRFFIGVLFEGMFAPVLKHFTNEFSLGIIVRGVITHCVIPHSMSPTEVDPLFFSMIVLILPPRFHEIG